MDELDDTLSRTIVHKTEAQFARHGVPEILLTDNGPQFIASEYEGLCNRYHIQHITSSPYWPQGNGKAEATVKIVKQFMKKSGKNISMKRFGHIGTHLLRVIHSVHRSAVMDVDYVVYYQ